MFASEIHDKLTLTPDTPNNMWEMYSSTTLAAAIHHLPHRITRTQPREGKSPTPKLDRAIARFRTCFLLRHDCNNIPQAKNKLHRLPLGCRTAYVEKHPQPTGNTISSLLQGLPVTTVLLEDTKDFLKSIYHHRTALWRKIKTRHLAKTNARLDANFAEKHV